MPTMWETFPIEVAGGLISNLPLIQQGLKRPGSARKLVNFEPSVSGGYRRINGYAKWDVQEVPSSGQIWGVAFFEGFVIASRGNNVYTSNGAGWTSIQGSRTQTTKQRFHRFNFSGTKKIICTDKVNYPWVWDGSNFVNLNSTVDLLAASHASDFKDHLFVARDNFVFFSAPFDETDFSPANGAGSFVLKDPVTGLHVFREKLFIFTETQIKVLDGSSVSDFTMSSVSDDIGCIEEDTIQEVSGDVMFLAPDGLRLLGATARIGDFSNNVSTKAIQDDILEFTKFYNSFSSVVVRNKSQYRILGYVAGRPTSLTEGYLGAQLNREQSPENPDGFEWSVTEGIKAFSADSVMFRGEEYIVFSEETGFVYRMENSVNSFDGSVVRSAYWTPYLSFSDPTFRKTLYSASLYFSPEGDFSGNLSVNFDLDSLTKIQPSSSNFNVRGGGVEYSHAVYGSDFFTDAPDAIIRVLLVGSGRNASLQFEFNDSTEPFTIDTIMVEFKTNDRR